MSRRPFAERHLFYVRLAAFGAACADERGRADDWHWHGLRMARRVALKAGHTQDRVDDETFAGIEQGRASSP